MSHEKRIGAKRAIRRALRRYRQELRHARWASPNPAPRPRVDGAVS